MITNLTPHPIASLTVRGRYLLVRTRRRTGTAREAFAIIEAETG